VLQHAGVAGAFGGIVSGVRAGGEFGEGDRADDHLVGQTRRVEGGQVDEDGGVE
jgi:hypothetical protein